MHTIVSIVNTWHDMLLRIMKCFYRWLLRSIASTIPESLEFIFAPGHEITSAKYIELYRCDVSPRKRRMCAFFNFDILAFYEELRIIPNKCDNLLLYICTDEANVLDETLFLA